MDARAGRVLLNLLLAAALLRFFDLGFQSLWLDEGATWSWAARETWSGTIFAEANHPPLWWMVTRVTIGLFGETEFALRAPAALLGLLSVYLAWRLGLRLFDRGPGDPANRRLALWLAACVAMGSYFVEYAQEARMYAALIAEALGLALLYLRWRDERERGVLVAYALLAAAALYTQYFAVWIVAAHALHALFMHVRARRRGAQDDARPFLMAVVASGLLFAPWLVHMLRNYEGIATGDPYEPFSRLFYVLWRIGAGPGLVVVDRQRLEEGIPAVLQEEWVIVLVTSLLWFPLLVRGLRRLSHRPEIQSFVWFSLFAPIVLVLLVFPWFPLIHERYLVFLAPWLFVLAVLGALDGGGTLRSWRVGALCLLLGLGLVAYHGVPVTLEPAGRTLTVGSLTAPERFDPDPDHPLRFLNHGHPYGKEPWREAHTYVRERARSRRSSEDLVLLHPEYLYLVWDYYDREWLDRIRLPREAITPEALLAAHGARLTQATRIFLVLAHEETEDPDAYVDIVSRALDRTDAWAGEAEPLGPTLFNRSWGVRVTIFNRR